MKYIKKILVLLLILALMAAMTVTAFADPDDNTGGDGSGTGTTVGEGGNTGGEGTGEGGSTGGEGTGGGDNTGTTATVSVTITQNPPTGYTAGAETYALYKIFDVTKLSTVTEPVTTDDTIEAQSGTGYTAPTGFAYTISTSSPWYDVLTTCSGQNWVTLTVFPGDSTKYMVTWKSGVDANETQAKAFASWLLANKGTIAADKTITSSSGTATTTDIVNGYYLITSTLGTNLVLATTNINITTKNEYIEDDKTVEESNYSVGDHVPYTIEVTLPASVDYSKTVTVHDTMDNVLSLDTDSVEAVVGTAAFSGITLVVSDDYTSDHNDESHPAVDGKVRFDFVLDISSLAPAAGEDPVEQTITITYTAELLDEALSDTGFINKEFVEYSQYTTVPKEVTVKTFDFDLDKVFVGAENDKTLKAKFELYEEVVSYTASDDGTYYLLKTGEYTTVAPTDETGDLYESTTQKYVKESSQAATALGFINDTSAHTGEDDPLKGKECYVRPDSGATSAIKTEIVVTQGTTTNVRGLKAGTYYLVETETESGYNMLAGVVAITISDTGVVTYIPAGGTESSAEPVTIQNQAGTVLPSTGGIGTTVFYVVGGLIIVSAALVLILKKRSSKDA